MSSTPILYAVSDAVPDYRNTKENLSNYIQSAINNNQYLEVRGGIFELNEFDGFGELLGVTFRNCKFSNGLSISNIKSGAAILFDDCEFSEHIYLEDIGNPKENINVTFSGSSFDISELNMYNSFLDNLLFSSVTSLSPAGLIKIRKTKVKTFKIEKSSLKTFDVDLDNEYSGTFFIRDSTLNDLFLPSSLAEKEEDRPLTAISLESSSIGELNISGRILKYPLRFIETNFRKSPKLHDVKIPQGSLFPAYDYYHDKSGERSVKAYRTLRLAMEEQRARDEEGMFYRLEQETILNTRSNSPKIVYFSYWYNILSRYGTNYRRPLMILFAVIIMFSFLYSLILSPVLGPTYQFDLNIIRSGVIFSIKQVVNPFSMLGDFIPFGEKYHIRNLTIIIMGTVQSLISLPLIALSILAIRWKFKRG